MYPRSYFGQEEKNRILVEPCFLPLMLALYRTCHNYVLEKVKPRY